MVTVAAVVAGFLSVAGCGVSVPTVSASPSVGKYEQTWPTPYNATTCAEWSGKMDDHQRWVAAGDMMMGGRKTWNVTAIPSDALINKFEAAVTEACVSPTMMVGTAGGLSMVVGGFATYGG